MCTAPHGADPTLGMLALPPRLLTGRSKEHGGSIPPVGAKAVRTAHSHHDVASTGSAAWERRTGATCARGPSEPREHRLSRPGLNAAIAQW